MKFRLLAAILVILLAVGGVSAGQTAAETVCVVFFYTDDDTGQTALEAMQALDQNLSVMEVVYYNVSLQAGLLDSALSAYAIEVEPPIAFVANAYFEINGTVQEIQSVILQLKTVVLTLAARGGTPCPFSDDGEVLFPRPVCIFAVFDDGESKEIIDRFRAALNDNISYLQLTLLDIRLPENQTMLEKLAAHLKQEIASPSLVIGETVWNLSNTSLDTVIADALHHALMGADCTPIQGGGVKSICVILLYSPTCHTCVEAKDALDDLSTQYPLNVSLYTTLSDTGLDLLFKYYNAFDVPDTEKGSFALFIGDRHYGDVDDFDGLEAYIQQHIDGGLECPEPAEEGNAEERVREFTLLTVIAGGLIDGINPCAFATLIFFIAYLERMRQGKKALLTIGLSFSAAVFVGYFLIGIGVMEFYYGIEKIGVVSEYVYLFAGLFALILAIFNIGDYLRMGRNEKPMLQLPRFLKRRRGRIIRVLTEERGILMLAGLAFATGLGISLLEFVCTGQILLPIMAVIKSASSLRATAIGYLILYTSMFILPLLIILGLFYKGFTSQKLGEMQKRRQGLVKLLTAVVLGIVGIYMLYISLG